MLDVLQADYRETFSSLIVLNRKVKKDLCLSSISGGTDIISCFALGNPIGAVYRGELQTRGRHEG